MSILSSKQLRDRARAQCNLRRLGEFERLDIENKFVPRQSSVRFLVPKRKSEFAHWLRRFQSWCALGVRQIIAILYCREEFRVVKRIIVRRQALACRWCVGFPGLKARSQLGWNLLSSDNSATSKTSGLPRLASKYTIVIMCWWSKK